MKNTINIFLLSLFISLNLSAQSNDTVRVKSDTVQAPYTDTSFTAVYQRAELLQRMKNYSGAKAEYLKIRFYHAKNPLLLRFSDFAIADMTLKEATTGNNSIKRSEATVLFEKFVKNYPTDERTPRARFALANLYRDDQNPDQALIILNSATQMLEPARIIKADTVEINDENTLLYVQAMIAKAQIHSSRKMNGNALTMYDDILSLIPEQKDALLGKAMVLADIGRTNEALAILARLKEKKGPTQEFAVNYYRELLQRGE